MLAWGRGDSLDKETIHLSSHPTQMSFSPFTWFNYQHRFLTKFHIVTSLNFLWGPVKWTAVILFYTHWYTLVTIQISCHWGENEIKISTCPSLWDPNHIFFTKNPFCDLATSPHHSLYIQVKGEAPRKKKNSKRWMWWVPMASFRRSEKADQDL